MTLHYFCDECWLTVAHGPETPRRTGWASVRSLKKTCCYCDEGATRSANSSAHADCRVAA